MTTGKMGKEERKEASEQGCKEGRKGRTLRAGAFCHRSAWTGTGSSTRGAEKPVREGFSEGFLSPSSHSTMQPRS